MSNITLPLDELYAPIDAHLSRVMRLLDDELRSDLLPVQALCERLKGYRGKMLRPAMLLLTGQALGGVRDAHRTLAAVVELVHLATLVHDDVLDEADMRRRSPTVNAMNGNEAAVMLGDYLISHAFHLCSSLDSQHASRAIGRTTNTVCEGELMQIHHRGDFNLSEREYFEIIRRKTAALTGTSCALGAHYAGADADVTGALEKFGIDAGMAFQIMDDVLDLFGAEQKMGKTLGRDLELGKMTLPVIYCVSSGDARLRGQLLDLLDAGQSAPRDDLAAVLRSGGGLDYAVSTARDFVQRALDCLAVLPDTPARSSMVVMTEYIVHREQ